MIGYAVDHQSNIQDPDGYEKPSHTPQYWQVLVHTVSGNRIHWVSVMTAGIGMRVSGVAVGAEDQR